MGRSAVLHCVFQAQIVREAQAGLLRDIRPNAVALVDGFGFEDYLLHSALGRRDGDVYRYVPQSLTHHRVIAARSISTLVTHFKLLCDERSCPIAPWVPDRGSRKVSRSPAFAFHQIFM